MILATFVTPAAEFCHLFAKYNVIICHWSIGYVLEKEYDVQCVLASVSAGMITFAIRFNSSEELTVFVLRSGFECVKTV